MEYCNFDFVNALCSQIRTLHHHIFLIETFDKKMFRTKLNCFSPQNLKI